jgi:hypothetical protein
MNHENPSITGSLGRDATGRKNCVGTQDSRGETGRLSAGRGPYWD